MGSSSNPGIIVVGGKIACYADQMCFLCFNDEHFLSLLSVYNTSLLHRQVVIHARMHVY